MGVWRYVCLPLGALVGRTVTRNQGLRDDLRAPDDPARSGLKEVLLAQVSVQAEGIILLSGMLRTGPRVDHAQAMEARGHPDGPDPHPWVDSLGVECDEADRLGEYQERIRLGLARLCGHGGTAEEPECPAQQQEEPTPSSSHGARSVRLCRRGQQRDTCGTVSRLCRAQYSPGKPDGQGEDTAGPAIRSLT